MVPQGFAVYSWWKMEVMARKYTLNGMRKKNKAAGYFWFQKGNGAFFDIISERVHYDGVNNWICVTHKNGRRTWYYFNPENGHITYVNSEEVPAYIREKA